MNYIIFQFLKICRMIRIEHSIFALPYAWAGMFLATKGWPDFFSFLFLTFAMVCVRSFAMAFNRLADVNFDCQNPRTAQRALCTGEISLKATYIFCACMGLAFIVFCALLNMVCLALSIPALIFVALYSFLKRFSPFSHFWLGAALGLAPLAGWLATGITSDIFPPLMLFLAVTFWVGAFDIYYSFQDEEFDKSVGLHSIPADFGAQTAMALAAFSHTLTVIFLLLTGFSAHLSWLWYALCLCVAVLLIVEHRMVNPSDLRNINMAFFTMNSIISPLVFLGVLLGLFM